MCGDITSTGCFVATDLFIENDRLFDVGRLGVKATNSKAKAKAKALTSKAKAKAKDLAFKAKAKAKDLASKAKAKDLTAKAKDLAPYPPIRSRPRKVFTVHYITLIIAALSKSLDDDASMCRK